MHTVKTDAQKDSASVHGARGKAARNRAIRRAYSSGEMTMTEIASEHDITRQRVEQIVHPKRNRARSIASAAVASGKLQRPQQCDECGARSDSIEAHHPDYDKPLEVEWLCSACHTDRHRGQQRVDRIPVPCPTCGKVKERLPSDSARFCSQICAGAARRGARRPSNPGLKRRVLSFRIREDLIEHVEGLAKTDGVSRAVWCENAVTREILRRLSDLSNLDEAA